MLINSFTVSSEVGGGGLEGKGANFISSIDVKDIDTRLPLRYTHGFVVGTFVISLLFVLEG
jgi:hypothetical protein